MLVTVEGFWLQDDDSFGNKVLINWSALVPWACVPTDLKFFFSNLINFKFKFCFLATDQFPIAISYAKNFIYRTNLFLQRFGPLLVLLFEIWKTRAVCFHVVKNIRRAWNLHCLSFGSMVKKNTLNPFWRVDQFRLPFLRQKLHIPDGPFFLQRWFAPLVL